MPVVLPPRPGRSSDRTRTNEALTVYHLPTPGEVDARAGSRLEAAPG